MRKPTFSLKRMENFMQELRLPVGNFCSRLVVVCFFLCSVCFMPLSSLQLATAEAILWRDKNEK